MSFYLEKIHHTYYFRLRVPADVAFHLGSNKIKKTLKTADYGSAKTLARSMLYATEKLFVQIRSGLMSEEQILELVREYKHAVLNKLTDKRRKIGIAAYLPPDIQKDIAAGVLQLDDNEVKMEVLKNNAIRRNDLYGRIQTNQFDSVKSTAEKIMRAEGLGKDFQILCEFLLKAQLEISTTIMDRMQDNYNNPFDNFKERLAGRPVAANPKSKHRLSDLWEAFKNSKVTKKSWRDATLRKNEDAFHVILDLLGDLKLTEFEEDRACLRLLEHIQLYPKNKNIIFPGAKYSPDMVKNEKFQPLSISHANFHLQLLSSLLRYGMKGNTWGLSVNHAEGLSFDDRRVVSEMREVFTKLDLENMFRGLSKTHMVNHPERFWLPILAMYTGARSNEVCQLRLEDIEEVEGVPVIHIRHRPELNQTTKNEQDRVVPVHPDLLRLEFLGYVEEVKKVKRNERLWPALALYKGKWNVMYGKHFNGTFCPKYVDNKAAGVHRSFHSLRHSFIDWFKQNGLDLDRLLRLKSIIGHIESSDLNMMGLSSDITLTRYGKEFSVQSQLEFISKLDYGVDLALLNR